MNIVERLNLCFFLEKTMAEIYHTMADKYPEGIKLFQKLSKEEEHHANIITLCMGFYKTTYDAKLVPPPSAMELTESLEQVMTAREKLVSGKLTLREALERSFQMEKCVAEDYFNTIRSSSTDKDIISYLEECYGDEKSHASQITDFLKTLPA